jgi:hypothetical protein
MTWRRRLPKRFYLKDGRTITTLADARGVFLERLEGKSVSDCWQRTGELLLRAAYRHAREPIDDAGAQLSLALKEEKLI